MSQQARNYVGVQEISESSQTVADVEPQGNGVPDGEFDIDVSILNTGDTTVWVRPGDPSGSNTTQDDSGYRLLSGESVDFNDHTVEDGDIYVYFPDTGGGEVQCNFHE